jgi:hypothetical protein
MEVQHFLITPRRNLYPLAVIVSLVTTKMLFVSIQVVHPKSKI